MCCIAKQRVSCDTRFWLSVGDQETEIDDPPEVSQIVGVNNRNLDTFEVSLDTSLRLSYLMPSNAIRISESGIRARADIDLLRAAGFHVHTAGVPGRNELDGAQELNYPALMKALLDIGYNGFVGQEFCNQPHLGPPDRRRADSSLADAVPN